MTPTDREPASRLEGPQEPETTPAGADRPTLPRVDRGISPIAGKFGGRNSRLITLAALGLGCGVFLFATWDHGDKPARGEPAQDEAARQVVPFEPVRRLSDGASLSDPTLDPDAPLLTPTPDAVPALEATDKAEPRGASPADQHRALVETARRSSVLAYSRSGGATAPQSEVPPGLVSGVLSAQSAQGRETPLDTLRLTSPVGQARAGLLPDRHMLLTAGATLPCVLQTAMDSATPGYVSCLLPSDVYSESGSVVLMERGTRVLGEYQGGLQQGRNRLFVLWTRAVTPAGVTIALASPASDALGRAGFDGAVDTHFWDRFGGALLLSLVDDGLYAAVGRGDAMRDTARTPSDAASVALQNSVDIPATLRKAQGSEVTIFVAQDLNFGLVYRLSAR